MVVSALRDGGVALVDLPPRIGGQLAREDRIVEDALRAYLVFMFFKVRE
jgi:hypothetical protein